MNDYAAVITMRNTMTFYFIFSIQYITSEYLNVNDFRLSKYQQRFWFGIATW